MSNSLTIRGIVNNFDSDKLKRSVELFGPCTVEMKDNSAFVTYLSEESVIRAVPALHNTNLFGCHPSKVDVSTQNPKVQLRTLFIHKSDNNSFKMMEPNGKSSPNFGGNSKVDNTFGNNLLDIQQYLWQ
jgi:hypothetical protein